MLGKEGRIAPAGLVDNLRSFAGNFQMTRTIAVASLIALSLLLKTQAAAAQGAAQRNRSAVRTMSDRNVCQERRANSQRRTVVLGGKLFEQGRTMSGRNLCQERRANSQGRKVVLGGKLFEVIGSRSVEATTDAPGYLLGKRRAIVRSLAAAWLEVA